MPPDEQAVATLPSASHPDAAPVPRAARAGTAWSLDVGSATSLPDPDCFIRRADAKPIGARGTRLEIWDPADVHLVVEVSDDSVIVDLNSKAKLYGGAGYALYWVVTRDAIYEHTSPTPQGYRTRTEYRPGDRIPIAYAESELSVDEILGQDRE